MSQMPPPFSAPVGGPPAKKNNTPAILGIVFGSIIVLCGGALTVGYFLIKGGIKMVSGTIGCEMNMAIVGESVHDYANEKGAFPNKETWQTDVAPYVAKMLDKSKEKAGPFKNLLIEPNGDWMCTDQSGRKTGIAFNDGLSGVKPQKVENPSSTAMVFEVPNPGRNVHMPYKELDKKGGPKIAGESRGYIVIHVKESRKSRKSGGITIDTSSDDSN